MGQGGGELCGDGKYVLNSCCIPWPLEIRCCLEKQYMKNSYLMYKVVKCYTPYKEMPVTHILPASFNTSHHPDCLTPFSGALGRVRGAQLCVHGKKC